MRQIHLFKEGRKSCCRTSCKRLQSWRKDPDKGSYFKHWFPSLICLQVQQHDSDVIYIWSPSFPCQPGGTGGLFTSVGTLGQLWLLPRVRNCGSRAAIQLPGRWQQLGMPHVPPVWLGAVQTQRKFCLLLVHFGRNISHFAKALPPLGVSHTWSSAAGGRMWGSKCPGGVWDEKTEHKLGVYLHNRLIMFLVQSLGHDSHRAARRFSVCLPNIFLLLPKHFLVHLIDLHFSVRNLSF